MKQTTIIAPNFTITNELLCDIKKMIKGKCTASSSYITCDDISEDESMAILKYVKTFGSFDIISNRKYYTTEELLDYEFFYCSGQEKPEISINFVQDVYKVNGNSSFDYSDYCPICKLGYKQIGPLYLKGITRKHDSKKLMTPFWTYWIVSTELKENLERNQLDGIIFLELYNKNGQVINNKFQMKPNNIMKNAVNMKNLKKTNSECYCNNIKISFDGLSLKLNKDIKKQLVDFNELFEHNISRLNGMYIISKKLLKILLSEKIYNHRDISVYPVIFE